MPSKEKNNNDGFIRTVQVQYKYSTSTVQVQFKCSASTVQVQYSTNERNPSERGLLIGGNMVKHVRLTLLGFLLYLVKKK